MTTEARIEGKKIVLTCDLLETPHPTTKNKNIMIATTSGEERISLICTGSDVDAKVNVNVYMSKEELDYMINITNKNNRQDGNVGNLGDILKHSALFNISSLMIKKFGCKMFYIDTHTYKLSAEFPYRTKWKEEISKRVNIDDYEKVELIYFLEKQLYRCSAGIVIDVFKKNGCKPNIILSEYEESTRKLLEHQLKKEAIECYKNKILENANDINNVELPTDTEAVLMLVDPWNLSKEGELWNKVNETVKSFITKGKEVVMEVFTCEKGIKEYPWQNRPCGLGSPVAVISEKDKYHLAVYATEKLKVEIKQLLNDMGWK